MSRDIRFVRVGNGQYPRIIVDSTVMTARDAAITLAGLEVAIAAALRECSEGKCLRCGEVYAIRDGYSQPTDRCHCDCGGVLAPVAEGRGEGEST